MLYPKTRTNERPHVNSSAEAAGILGPFFEEEMEMRETFRVLMLDRANRAKCVFTASIGGLHGTIADAKIIFRAALGCLASSIVLAHNHPGGQLKPSEKDLVLTRQLVEGARLLDIAVFDHLILTREGYFSFNDRGLL